MTTTLRSETEVQNNGAPVSTAVLWILQGLLAALFLFAGGMKLALPVAKLTQQMAVPGWFVRFIGAAEVLGGIGLILPGLLRICPRLIALAAAGLVILMTGATVFTVVTVNPLVAMFPLVVGVLCAVVGYGRSDLWAEQKLHPRVYRSDRRST